MRLRTFVLVALTASLMFRAHAKEPNDSKESLKQKLFARYDQQSVVLIPWRFLMGPRISQKLWGVDYFSLRADHFYKSMQVPKAFRKASVIDEGTFVSANQQGVSNALVSEPHEGFNVLKFYVKENEVILSLDSRTPGKTGYGLDFHFVFPRDLLASGDYEAIIKEINQYVLPQREDVQESEAAKKVEIQPGMSKEDVIKSLGEPLKTIVFGNRTVLKYQDVTVELVDNKVTELKAN